jgi:hypothetical protein
LRLLIQGEDPISFWEVFSLNAQTSDLADFAIMLLELVVNQAGLERSFSDFLNKKNKKRNRLSLKKMAQQAKVRSIFLSLHHFLLST